MKVMNLIPRFPSPSDRNSLKFSFICAVLLIMDIITKQLCRNINVKFLFPNLCTFIPNEQARSDGGKGKTP